MIGQTRSDEARDREVEAPIANRIAPRAACQPQPAAGRRADRGDEQERDAQASGPDARPVDDAGGGQQVGRREGGDDRAEVERAHAAVDQPRDEERDADREEQQRARGLERREQLPQQQQRAEHDEEDPEPRQPAARRRARDLGPLPGVGMRTSPLSITSPVTAGRAARSSVPPVVASPA